MRAIGMLLWLGACASNAVDGGGASLGDAGGVGCLSSNECPTGTFCNDFGQCEAPSGMGSGSSSPPETEVDLGSPISAQRYVYVAMTAENELARIDGSTLAVTATPVGASPRDVATINGSDGAVVLDAQNGTATIVRPDPNGDPSGDKVKVLATLQHLNRIDIDPTGRYAVIWFDLVKAVANGGLTGIGSFQDVTVVGLQPGAEHAVNLTVGFRPRAVQFDAAGNRGYVITQDGVSVIDLASAAYGTPTIVPPLPVADPSVSVDDLEVQVFPSGEYAAVRQAGLAGIRVVSVGHTNPGQATTLPLTSAVTDIDLYGSRLYAMERDAKKLAVIDVPAMTVNTIDLSDGAVGSIQLSADGTKALTFTNATLDPRITMINLATLAHTTWPLKKGVRAVLMSPSSTSALVVNSKEPGDPSTADTVEEYIARSYGYTVLDLASGFGKLQLTPVDAGSFAYALDGSKAYVALDGGDDATATRALQVITIQNGVVETKQLGSPPSSVGVLPGVGIAFTAQRHPLGRVSFIDITTDAMRTVTGFDLNSHVVN
ncbi:MAG: hypothetical protein QM831_02980 [Kofleriaceae bacterium]